MPTYKYAEISVSPEVMDHFSESDSVFHDVEYHRRLPVNIHQMIAIGEELSGAQKDVFDALVRQHSVNKIASDMGCTIHNVYRRIRLIQRFFEYHFAIEKAKTIDEIAEIILTPRQHRAYLLLAGGDTTDAVSQKIGVTHSYFLWHYVYPIRDRLDRYCNLIIKEGNVMIEAKDIPDVCPKCGGEFKDVGDNYLQCKSCESVFTAVFSQLRYVTELGGYVPKSYEGSVSDVMITGDTDVKDREVEPRGFGCG